MDDTGHPIYIARLDDDKFIAVSKSSPRFCLQAATVEEARGAARRALRFYAERKDSSMPMPKEVRMVSPVFQRELLTA